MTAIVVTRAGTGGRVGLAAAGLVVVLLVAAPYLVTSDITHTLVDLFVFVVIATMWNLLAGYGGLVSVGQQAYLGAGAYAMIALSDLGGVNPFLAVPLAALCTAVLAVPLSFLAFRLRGGYFAIGTWVLAEVVKLVTAQIGPLGKGSGASLTTASGYDPDIRVAYTYWLALAVAAGSVGAVYLLIRTRAGLQLTAIRDDATAAEAAGVRVRRAKRLVYLIAGAGAGSAGAIVCLNTLTVEPESAYSVQWSAYIIFMVVVGGIGTIEGPIVGAVLFFVLQQALSAQGPVYLIILGAVGVTTVLVAPRGLWGSTVGRTSFSIFPAGHTLY
jgi:branched-chain amino acid transport system permease protein